MNRGFTVVEVVVTLVVIMVIMTLSVVGMRGMQANARDVERADDVEAIARGFEQRYKLGNKYIIYPPNYDTGYYPSSREVDHALKNSSACDNANYPIFTTPCPVNSQNYLSEWLPGTSQSSYVNSSSDGAVRLIASRQNDTASISSLVNQDYYVYIPYASDNTICVYARVPRSCVRYEIYYKNEVSNSVMKKIGQHQ